MKQSKISANVNKTVEQQPMHRKHLELCSPLWSPALYPGRGSGPHRLRPGESSRVGGSLASEEILEDCLNVLLPQEGVDGEPLAEGLRVGGGGRDTERRWDVSIKHPHVYLISAIGLIISCTRCLS